MRGVRRILLFVQVQLREPLEEMDFGTQVVIL